MELAEAARDVLRGAGETRAKDLAEVQEWLAARTSETPARSE